MRVSTAESTEEPGAAGADRTNPRRPAPEEPSRGRTPGRRRRPRRRHRRPPAGRPRPGAPPARDPRTSPSAAARSGAGAGAPNGARSRWSPRRARTTASRAPWPNMSAPSPRTSARAPGPSWPAGSTRSARPRRTANGRAPSLPCASSAAPAISSATAGAVTARVLPWASTRPSKASTTSRPAAPTARSVWPSRQARPGGVGDHDADRATGALVQRRAQGAGGGVRVHGQQHHAARPRRWRRRSRPRPG